MRPIHPHVSDCKKLNKQLSIFVFISIIVIIGSALIFPFTEFVASRNDYTIQKVWIADDDRYTPIAATYTEKNNPDTVHYGLNLPSGPPYTFIYIGMNTLQNSYDGYLQIKSTDLLDTPHYRIKNVTISLTAVLYTASIGETALKLNLYSVEKDININETTYNNQPSSGTLLQQIEITTSPQTLMFSNDAIIKEFNKKDRVTFRISFAPIVPINPDAAVAYIKVEKTSLISQITYYSVSSNSNMAQWMLFGVFCGSGITFLIIAKKKSNLLKNQCLG